MVMKARKYADGGKVVLPGPETRKIKPAPLPPPQRGPKPEKVKTKKYADGGKVSSEKPPPRPKPPPPKPAPEPKRSLMDIARGKTRREQERALGLKDGGKVKR